MARPFPQLPPKPRDVLLRQTLFFVASAADGWVNVSPKGLGGFRVSNERQGEAEREDDRRRKNAVSLDGLPTGLA